MTSPNGDLQRRAIAGDHDALSSLIERHGGVVRQRFRREIPRRFQSVLSLDDLMQETYTDAFMHIREFEPRDARSFENWLTKIARNNLINTLAMLDAVKRGGTKECATRHDLLEFYENLGGVATTPSRHVARLEAKAALEAALRKLPQDHRLVVQLYDLEGQSVDDVSAKLQRGAGAVFMLRNRAHRALRRLLGKSSRTVSDFA